MKETQLEKVLGQKVTLNGTARDAKGGAVLLTDDGTPVYIEGLAYWTPEIEGTRISTSGVLTKIKYIPDPTIGEDGGISQGAIGMQFVLTKIEKEED
jgi:hypothetical protein